VLVSIAVTKPREVGKPPASTAGGSDQAAAA
jgi:hypothetical protein